MKKTIYALVVHYSFDSETPVYLFDTVEEAQEELRKQFEEEKRIDTEENGWNVEEDIDPEGMWASLTNSWDDGSQPDVTEWSIGYVRNK